MKGPKTRTLPLPLKEPRLRDAIEKFAGTKIFLAFRRPLLYVASFAMGSTLGILLQLVTNKARIPGGDGGVVARLGDARIRPTEKMA